MDDNPRFQQKYPNYRDTSKRKGCRKPTYRAATKKDLSKEDKGAATSTVCALSIQLSQRKETIQRNHSRQTSDEGKGI